MTKIVELCENSQCCPRVELDDHEIRIGEPGNLVKLKPNEWETLRQKVLNGQL